jgi:hypothetical protein
VAAAAAAVAEEAAAKIPAWSGPSIHLPQVKPVLFFLIIFDISNISLKQTKVRPSARTGKTSTGSSFSLRVVWAGETRRRRRRRGMTGGGTGRVRGAVGRGRGVVGMMERCARGARKHFLYLTRFGYAIMDDRH